MNINRQSGRRRGRGGGGRSPNNAPNMGGNRQDNRQRGNASQLHEKYKAMARDAQLAGDRVQTEYYLQFADHYFRILNESRARFEEQRRQRDDYSDEDEGEEENVAAQDGGEERFEPRAERQEREPRQDREYRPDREPRRDREYREEREMRPERELRQDREPRADRGQRNGEPRPRRDRDPEIEYGNEGQIALDALPPAIAAEDEAVKAPRRRTRRPRPEGEADIAPAA